VQVIAWGTIFEMTYNVSSGTLNLIPRLHDEAGSTSWLYERSSSQLAERSTSTRRAALWMFAILHHSNDQIASSSSQLYERTTSARRALVEPARRASFIV